MRRRGIVLAVVGLVGLATPTLPSPRGGGNVYAASPRGGGLMNAAAINSPYVADALTTQQYHLTASDGRTWRDTDPVNRSDSSTCAGDSRVLQNAPDDL